MRHPHTFRLQGRFLRLSTRHAFAPILLAMLSLVLHAQDAASPKVTLFGGAGISASPQNSKGEFQGGVSVDEAAPGAWGGFSFEGGYLAPWSRVHAGSAFLSADYMAAWSFGQKAEGKTSNGAPYWSDRGWKLIPFAAVGYTRLFQAGNAINFGGGVDYRLSHTHAIRTELRDYYSFSAPQHHNVAVRIGLVFYIPD